jgi:hypothetical protein
MRTNRSLDKITATWAISTRAQELSDEMDRVVSWQQPDGIRGSVMLFRVQSTRGTTCYLLLCVMRSFRTLTWLRWKRRTLVLGSDRICGIAKHFVKALKFCLNSHSL